MRRFVRNGTIDFDEGQAALQIERECDRIEEEYKIQSSVLERVDFGSDPDALARLLDNRATHWRVFIPWLNSLNEIHPDAFDVIVNIIVWGESLRWIDRDLHKIDDRFTKRDGFARDTLVAGLNRWIEIKRKIE